MPGVSVERGRGAGPSPAGTLSESACRDRPLRLEHAQRTQDQRGVGGDGAALRRQAGGHRQGARSSTPPSSRSARTTASRPSSIRTGRAARPISVFESGAILLYLAEKSGRFLPEDPRLRIAVLEWLMWQMGGFGPMPGQVHHFLAVEEKDRAYGLARYLKETRRLYGVLDRRLAQVAYVAGPLSVADFAILGWAWRHERHQVDLADYPHVERWYRALMDRPAVQAGVRGGAQLTPHGSDRVQAVSASETLRTRLRPAERACGPASDRREREHGRRDQRSIRPSMRRTRYGRDWPAEAPGATGRRACPGSRPA